MFFRVNRTNMKNLGASAAAASYLKLSDLKGKKLAHTSPSSNSGNLAPLIANGLRCEEGDRRIGRDLTKPTISSLNEICRTLNSLQSVLQRCC